MINQYGQVMDRVVLQDQNEQAVRVEVGHYAAGAYYVRVDNGEAVPMVKKFCLLYTSPSPRDRQKSRMPSSA